MRIQKFDYSVNLKIPIQWKYDQANNIVAILNAKQEWYDIYQTLFWEEWHVNVFDLLTANVFGVSVWSYILNIPLYIDQNPESPNKPNFGFNAYNPVYPDLINTYLNFNNSNFSTIGSVLSLTLEEQRFLLRLRYFQLSTNNSTTNINNFLNYLISTSSIDYSGTIYMLDGLDMSVEYVFTASDFPNDLLTIMLELDIFPHDAGVEVKYFIESQTIWGLGVYNQNFNNGNFIQQTI